MDPPPAKDSVNVTQVCHGVTCRATATGCYHASFDNTSGHAYTTCWVFHDQKMHQCFFLKYLTYLYDMILHINYLKLNPKQPNPNCSIRNFLSHLSNHVFLICSCWILEMMKRRGSKGLKPISILQEPGDGKLEVVTLSRSLVKQRAFYRELNSQMIKQGCKDADVIN